MMELVELKRVRDRVDLPSYRRCADRVTVALHRLWRSAIFRRAACSSPRTRPYGTRDPAVHMRGPDAAHRCTAQMLRLQAPHRGSLGRSPRTHLLAWMLRSGSEETTTEAGPANSRARITPICTASPLTTAARGNLRLSHRHCPSSKQMGLLSVFHKGGSGSSLFDVKPLGVDGSSGGFGWSVF